MTLPGYSWDRWPYFAGKLSWDITTTQVNSALHPSEVAKSSTSFGWGKGGKVTSAGCQVTLCDLIWHVISRSGVVISITNCYIRFTLLYFTFSVSTAGCLPLFNALPNEFLNLWLRYSASRTRDIALWYGAKHISKSSTVEAWLASVTDRETGRRTARYRSKCHV